MCKDARLSSKKCNALLSRFVGKKSDVKGGVKVSHCWGSKRRPDVIVDLLVDVASGA